VLRDRIRAWFNRGERTLPIASGAAPRNREQVDEPTEEDLLPGDYWHVTSSSPANFLFNNVAAGKGWLPSMSAVRRDHGERFITLGDLYPLTGAATEEIWESVRAERFPQKPSRRGATFLFDRRDLAEMAAQKWWPDTDATVLRARISRDARVHMGHVGWFDVLETPPEENAASYWARRSPSVLPELWEYVVDGDVYFPGWGDPPFRQLAGKPTDLPASRDLGPAEVVTCPACGLAFEARAPNLVTFTTADRARCRTDPERPMLCDCENVSPLVEAAWQRLKHRA
jgi:hypothetical protein